MKVLVILCAALLAVSAAQYAPVSLYGGLGYAGTPWAGYAPYSAPYNTYNTAPYNTYNYAPRAYAPAPVALASSQYHAQDDLGGYSYGYNDGLSTKNEHRNAYGATVGSYSYVDSKGKTQTVNYIADAGGFRVSGTNLPVGPKAAAVATPVGPAPVQDTPEVQAAKAEFQRLYAAAASAAAAAPEKTYRRKRSAGAPLPVQDTPAVKAAKAEHAYLYNKAAAAAAAAPEYGYAGYGHAGYGHAGYGHAGYGHAGYGHAGYGLGYAGRGLGYGRLGYAGGLGYAGYGYNGLYAPYAARSYAPYAKQAHGFSYGFSLPHYYH